ncbi:hypothetical protein, partial [Rubripirellula obstinata]|uniref:hypothetical protein n=1 Tax=Rubripirellula obstinata TaxID=406547 RepID=UPI001EE40961
QARDVKDLFVIRRYWLRSERKLTAANGHPPRERKTTTGRRQHEPREGKTTAGRRHPPFDHWSDHCIGVQHVTPRKN